MQWWWSSSHLCGGGGKVGMEGGRGSLFVWRREQPGLQIATIRDTKEGNASDTMHACSGIVGCQCREGAMSILLTGATRFRLLRKCRTYEDAVVRRAGPKMTCSCREDASVLLRNLWLQDSLCGRMLRDTQFSEWVHCAVSP